jgi:flagellar hook-basal body complex protein FliE
MMMSSISPVGLHKDLLNRAQEALKPQKSETQGHFGDHMKNALSQVAALQNQASSITQAYEAGDEVDVTKVMLAREKSSLAFEATMQIRNKLLSAYKDIISMPV